jgi:protein phosphatase
MQEGWLLGQTVAGFRLQRALGRGAHGEVYLAEAATGGPVALKLAEVPSGEATKAWKEHFLSGARTAQRLVHPGIVAVHGAGIEGRLAWLAMELVPGGDLARYTASHRLLPEGLVLMLGQRIARAVAYAHRQGVVHRDLKPANVLVHLPGQVVKLADFGLARAEDAAQTGTGIVVGSPAYMAPEQLAGNVPSPSTDLYALGVMLFQLLSGRLPHDSPSMGELLRQVATEPAPDLRELVPDIQPGLAALVARLLAKQPNRRPGDGDALAAELQVLAQQLAPQLTHQLAQQLAQQLADSPGAAAEAAASASSALAAGQKTQISDAQSLGTPLRAPTNLPVPTMIELFAAVDPGRARSNNEDSVATDDGVALAVLADGMGGYNAGEVASNMATSFIQTELGRWLREASKQASDAEVRRAMDICVDNANRAIFNASNSNPQYAGMGTTLVLAVFRDDRLLLGHVGDSRCYRMRASRLQQITRDHSLLQEQLDAGLITPEQAAFSSNKNLVTRAVGVEDSVMLETHQHDVEPGDLFLLCSDGLSDMLDDAAIEQVLQTHESLESSGQALIAAANDAGGKDNISVILARTSGGASAPAWSWWPFRR